MGRISKGHLGILIYFLTLCGIAFILNSMFAVGWEKGFIKNTLNTLPAIYGKAWKIFFTFCFGGFYGAAIIVFIDRKKRLQGVLILISSLIFTVTYSQYNIIPYFEFFLIGIGLGTYMGYIPGRKRGFEHMYRVPLFNLEVPVREYPRATKIVTLLAISFLTMALVNYIVGLHQAQVLSDNSENILKYSLLTAAFIGIFSKFARYEASSSKVFVVGPRGVGKTVFMCGCYERAWERGKIITMASKDLRTALDELRRKSWPAATESDMEQYYEFSYDYGLLFTKEINVAALDYGGELLETNIAEITRYLEKKTKDLSVTPEEGFSYEKIGDEIFNANKLIFLVDSQAIGEGYSSYINEYYLRILEALPHKSYHVMVTKSDRFCERKLNDEEYTHKDYEKLKEIIFEELEKKEPFFLELKGGAEDVIPVSFFELDSKPVLTGNKFMTIGYDKVLEVLEK